MKTTISNILIISGLLSYAMGVLSVACGGSLETFIIVCVGVDGLLTLSIFIDEVE